MKPNAKHKNRTQASSKTANQGKNKPSQTLRDAEKATTTSYMITASLMLPIACILIYYVINKPSIIMTETQEPLSSEVSGWELATTEEEIKYNTSLCTIERRDAESLDLEEFERVYR